MKRYLILVAAVLLVPTAALAQWSDNFDSYANGTVLDNVNGWFGWANSAASAGVVTNAQSRSGPHSLFNSAQGAGGGDDAVYPFSGISSGQWSLTAWHYLERNNHFADAFLIVNNVYNHGGPFQWTIEIQFDTTTGNVLDDFRPETNVIPIAYDQWSEILINIDLDADTQTTFYNGTELSTGQYAIRGGVVEIGNLDLFTTGAPQYWDDIALVPEPASMVALSAGVLLLLRRRRRKTS